ERSRCRPCKESAPHRSCRGRSAPSRDRSATRPRQSRCRSRTHVSDTASDPRSQRWCDRDATCEAVSRVSRRGATSIFAAASLVGAVSAATGLHLLPLSALAATPGDVARGKLWLLATSALVADRPWLPSLLGFAAVGLAAVAVCGARTTWVLAAVG